MRALLLPTCVSQGSREKQTEPAQRAASPWLSPVGPLAHRGVWKRGTVWSQAHSWSDFASGDSAWSPPPPAPGLPRMMSGLRLWSDLDFGGCWMECRGEGHELAAVGCSATG